MAKSPASRSDSPRTLSIDIGGSGIKVACVDARAELVGERLRIDTPLEATAAEAVERMAELAAALPSCQRIAIGFPGVVRAGRVRTSPNLPHPSWIGFELEAALAQRCGAPALLINDADMQGFGAITGRGMEVVVTLGTGVGSAFFVEGVLGPHLELAHHVFEKDKSYNQRLGERARRAAGDRKWNRRVERMIAALRSLANFDQLHIGGGNARRIELELPPDVRCVSNDTALIGGVRMWERVQA